MRKSKLTSQHGTQKVKTHNSTTQKTEKLIHFNNLLDLNIFLTEVNCTDHYNQIISS